MHCIKCRCSALLTLFLLVTVLVLSSSSNVYATETAANYNLSGTNKSTGYEYILEDSANFIDDAVKGKLISQMKKATEYCNIAVVTTTSHPYGSTESYAVNTFEGYFGTGANGVIFVIDRDLNEIYLACEGSAQRTIPNSKCNSICDNTYIYATSSHDYDYFTCCMETIDQVNTVLAGGHISQPLRYISSIFIALAAGMIFALYMHYPCQRAARLRATSSWVQHLQR